MIEYEDYESHSDHSFLLQSNSTQTLPSQLGHCIQFEIDLENLNCSKNRLNRKRLSRSECKLNLGRSTSKFTNMSRRVRRQRRALVNQQRHRSTTATSSTEMVNKKSDMKYKPSLKVEKLLNDSRGMRKYLLDYDSIMSFSKHQTTAKMHSCSSFSSNWELNDIEMFLNSTPITSSRHILPNSREAQSCQNTTQLQSENRALCSPIPKYDKEHMNGILSLDSNLIRSIRFIDSSSTQDDEEDNELISSSKKQTDNHEQDDEDTILHSCNINNNSIGVQSSNRCSSGYLSDF